MAGCSFYLMLAGGVEVNIEREAEAVGDLCEYRTLVLSDPDYESTVRIDFHPHELRAMLEAALKLVELDDPKVFARITPGAPNTGVLTTTVTRNTEGGGDELISEATADYDSDADTAG